MTIESLSSAIEARPFRPFRIHLADGRTIAVPHPEFIAFKPKGRTAVVMDEGAGDGFEIVDLLLCVSLRFDSTPAA